MAGNLNRAILELEGVLANLFPDRFRSQLGLVLDQYRDERVGMVVTTAVDRREEEAERAEDYYSPGSEDKPVSFTWNATGDFPNVIRRLREGFLNQLGEEELRRPVYLAVYLENAKTQLPSPVELTGEAAAEPIAVPESNEANPPQEIPQSRVLRALGGLLRSNVEHESPPAGAALSTGPDTPNLLAPPAIQSELAAAVTEKVIPLKGDEQALGQTAARVIELSAVHGTQREEEVEPRTDALDQPPGVESPLSDVATPAPPDGSMQPDTETDDDHNASQETVDRTDEFEADSTHRGVDTDSREMLFPGKFYLDHFGFDYMPFNNTPDPHFYYPTSKHEEALSRMVYTISERKGFVMISGEIGAGKSTLCRTLLAQLPDWVKTALITHTHLDATQILRAIAEDLGLDAGDLDRYDTLKLINEYLIEEHSQGHVVCIIIDEAQNLSTETLEEVRMISNLETAEDKLVQLIIMGQPELREKLAQPDLRQLRERIIIQYHLEPLSLAETVDYINHRLLVAKPAKELNFTRNAMVETFRFSGGTPRLTNGLCDNALLTAFSRGDYKITPSLIREAARDMNMEPRMGGLARLFRRK